MQPTIKSETDIKSMRTSGKILAQILDYLKDQVKPGVDGKYINELATRELIKLGAKPAFLGYQGFPAAICVSINDEVVHGIPSKKKFIDGDIVSLDFGVDYRGMITDAATSVIVGEAKTQNAVRLLEATEQALERGISKVKDGARIGDISVAIENRLLDDNLGIVESLVGHGVGHKLHEPPEIPNYGVGGRGPVLKKNMTIAIEPMATLGSKQVVLDKDGWTVRTQDGSLAAHFEHTVLVTENGAEILTKLNDNQ